MRIHLIKVIVAIFLFTFICSETSYSQMYWNQTASFAGSPTSYISVPNSSAIDLTGSFTLEAWINLNSFSISSKGIMAKGSSLGTSLKYGLRITPAGRITISTNGSQRLISRISNPLSTNTWTHVSATYNSTTSLYTIYINGISDTTATVLSSSPASNTDSLFIGISGASTPFNGRIDEVRIWNRDLSAAETGRYFRTSLCASGGIYSGLVFSMPFQKESSSGTIFSVKDFSDNNNIGNPRNVTAADESYRPLHTISQNDCIDLDGDEDYLAGKDTSTIDPSLVINLDCWVYPRSVQTCNLITKGNQYALMLENGILKARINGNTISTTLNIPPNQWTRVSFQYTFGTSQFFINGKFRSQISALFGNVSSGTDSLYIGGVPGDTGDFNGFIDEVRISDNFYIDSQLFNFTYKSMDKSNDPSPTQINISYNLDGSVFDNAENGGPKLFFRNNAQFSHPGTSSGKPVSPLLRDASNSIQEGYYLFDDLNTRIPASGTAGSSTMFAFVNMNKTITDVDVFVAINHTNISSLMIYLIAPNGDSVRLINNFSPASADNNLVTLFDDQADSSLANNKYSSLYTKVKPENNMNPVFNGDNTSGTWKLRITDLAGGDTGIVCICGIRFNNMSIIEKNFDMTSYMQGFYNPVTNIQVKDTLRLYLREAFSPYALVDSSKAFSDQYGKTRFSFANAQNDHQYYIQLNHRNAVETWGANVRLFKYSISSVNFYISPISVLGNNEVQVDSTPVIFATYNGDPNQDGLINLQDIILTFNDAANFVTGYFPTDATGDNIINLTDIIVTFNNSANFVHKITL